MLMAFGFGFSLSAYPLRGGAGNNPFNQSGPTLDLAFVGTAGNLSGSETYTLNTNFIAPQYQIAAQYVVWETNVGLVDKTFSQIITFTRASTATYFDSAGVLQSAAIDTPRLDYDPATLAARGLLIEEQRTNSIRNNTMQGAVAGTPGTLPTNWTGDLGGGQGLSPQITDVSTVNGIATIGYQTFGTTTSAGAGALFCEAANQIAASPGQTWTGSYYLALVGGSIANLNSFSISLRENDSGGNFLRQTLVSASAISSTLARFTVTATLGVSTAFVTLAIRAEQPTSTVIDYTLRIGLPQLELGAFATSVIPTTTTALTRSADVASVNTLSPWFNATEGTLYADWTSFIPNGTSPGSTYAAGFTDNIASSGAAQLTIQNRPTSNQIRIWQSTTGGGLDNFITPTSTTFQGKAAATYGSGANVAASANGGAVVTMTDPIQTTTFNALLLGLFTTAATGSGSNYLNGYLRRITYYPRRLSNAELQSLTS